MRSLILDIGHSEGISIINRHHSRTEYQKVPFCVNFTRCFWRSVSDSSIFAMKNAWSQSSTWRRRGQGPLYNTVRTPQTDKSVWGITKLSQQRTLTVKVSLAVDIYRGGCVEFSRRHLSWWLCWCVLSFFNDIILHTRTTHTTGSMTFHLVCPSAAIYG